MKLGSSSVIAGRAQRGRGSIRSTRRCGRMSRTRSLGRHPGAEGLCSRSSPYRRAALEGGPELGRRPWHTARTLEPPGRPCRMRIPFSVGLGLAPDRIPRMPRSMPVQLGVGQTNLEGGRDYSLTGDISDLTSSMRSGTAAAPRGRACDREVRGASCTRNSKRAMVMRTMLKSLATGAGGRGGGGSRKRPGLVGLAGPAGPEPAPRGAWPGSGGAGWTRRSRRRRRRCASRRTPSTRGRRWARHSSPARTTRPRSRPTGRALELKPGDPQLLYGLANALAMEDKKREAISVLRQVLHAGYQEAERPAQAGLACC